jgi:hypothetical protein
LIPNGHPNINITTKNFFKIVKLIVDNSRKTEFAPNELAKIYGQVLENYESEINPATFQKIKDALQIFVRNGGKVVIQWDDKPHASLPKGQMSLVVLFFTGLGIAIAFEILMLIISISLVCG